MRARGYLAILGPVMLTLAGCGASGVPALGQSTTSPTSGLSSASPTVEQLLVVADPSPYSGSTPAVVKFFSLEGREVSRITLSVGDQVIAAAGARVFVLGTNGKLRGLHRNGSYEDLADFGNASVVVTPSPDGTRWLWSTSSFSGSTITSAIHLGGYGLTPRVVETFTGDNRALRPYEWTAVGVFVEHGAVGIGGYIPYLAATGAVDRLDLEKNTATRVANSDTCSFSDMSRDGTVVCFPMPRQHAVRIAYPDGRVTDIPLSTPRFNLTGDAYFSGNGQELTVAGAVGLGFQNGERYGTDLVKTGDASISRLALDGVRPAGYMRAACWLPDGSLVVYRPDNSADGPGIFIFTASGTSLPITTSGVPVGVLTG